MKMTITQAAALIAQALESGRIDRETATRAQDAIRASSYAGYRMTAADRARIITLRFGIA
jgi:hypothetical protein